MGKLYLSLVSAFAESERELITERVQEGVTTVREEIARKGAIQTHWGNAKGAEDTKRIKAIANEASCRAKQDAAIRWRENSAAYKMVREWCAMGKNRNEMFSELQRLYEHAPEKFGTIKSKCVTRSVLDRWCREMNPLAACY